MPSDDERRRLADLEGFALLDTAADPRLDRITALAATLAGTPTAVVTLVDERRQWFKSRVGMEVPETARDIAICNLTIRGDEMLVIPDTGTDPRLVDNTLVTGPMHIRFYAGVPLRTLRGQNIGTLAVIDYRPRQLEPWQRRALKELAGLVMSELELWRRVVEADEEHARTLTTAEQRHAAERELERRRFHALVDKAPDLIVLVGRDGNVEYASPSVESVLGRAAPMVVGSAFTEWFDDPSTVDAVRALLRETLAEPGCVRRASWRLRARNGEQRHLDAIVQNLLADPAVHAVVVNARDVTAEVAARERLARAEAQLRTTQTLEALGRLAGGIAHDFNNLLTVILGGLELAKPLAQTSPPLMTELESIGEAAQRAAALTRQILAFGRRQPSTRVPEDLGRVVLEVEPLLRRLLRANIELALEPESKLCARVDRSQIEQVLINLVANAQDAMPRGGRLLIRTEDVELDAEAVRDRPWARAGKFVLLTVRDNGIGISDEALPHLFEPFFTTKHPGEGTGLGLATVYGITTQHDGFVHVASQEGQGTTLQIYVPAVEGRAPSTVEHAPFVAPLPGHSGVLLAEDDPQVNALMTRVLERAGYRVFTTTDGEAAVDAFDARQDEIDLVVLDAVMPRLGGAEALARMRARRPSLRYVFCSGYRPDGGAPADADQHWLTKPYTPNALLERVARELARTEPVRPA